MQRGRIGSELAEIDSYTSGRKRIYRCADRVADHGYQIYVDRRKGTSQTYRRGGFPPGDIPGGASGTAAGEKPSAGTDVSISDGSADGTDRTSYERCRKDARNLSTAAG